MTNPPDLLRAQVEMLDPAEVVLICGPGYWHSAAKPAGLDDLPKQEGPLIAAGRVDGRAWVVGYHPRYASQGFRVGAYTYAAPIARTVRPHARENCAWAWRPRER